MRIGLLLVVRVVISDGIGLVELSWLQRRLLGRPYIAFELARIVAVYEEKTPKRRTLGKRRSPNVLFLFKTGEYLRGVKRLLWVGGFGSKTVRILLLNPAFDEIYLRVRKPERILDILAKYGKKLEKADSETN